jgi:hypothetical protein
MKRLFLLRSKHSGGKIPAEIKVDNDNDKKELEKIVENREVNEKLINKVKNLNIKPRKKKFINLDIESKTTTK